MGPGNLGREEGGVTVTVSDSLMCTVLCKTKEFQDTR